ncbi:MAG: Serine/threonine-protein kinase PrkC [Planctomycetota bacterium]|jgi:serine/threonine-protein kinase
MTLEYLGPYKIDKVIGRGGMGTVYKAIHSKTNDIVAIKMISTSIGDQSRFRRRFQIEIDTLNRLKHPNIVHLIGYGEESGQLFYAMEYVEGESLHECLKKHGPLPWDEVIRIGIDIASALKQAHDMGIIHRDLKPANLLFDATGHVKLVDFGIAKLFGSDEMTVVGAVIGTADYMSPEQAEGKIATSRSDLYSLGSVLFAALTGRAPFSGKSVADTLYALKFSTPPSLRRIASDIPIELAELIEQLLSKDSASRPPTALVVANRLRAMQQGFKKKPELLDSVNIGTQESHTSLDLAEFKKRLADNIPGTMDRITIDAQEAEQAQVTDPTSLVNPINKPFPSPDQPHEDRNSHPSHRDKSDTTNIAGKEDHFTVVEKQKKQAQTNQSYFENASVDDQKSWLSIATIVAMILLCLGVIAYLLTPRTANQSYSKFSSAIETGDESELISCYEQMQEFVSHFPNDPRTPLVQASIEETEAIRLARSLTSKSKLVPSSGADATLQQSLSDALRLEKVDPELCIKKLDAICSIFAAGEKIDIADRKLLEVAKATSERLQKTVNLSNAQALKSLSEKITWADENLSREKRDEFMRAIIELYREKSWAKSLVEKANISLSKVDSSK